MTPGSFLPLRALRADSRFSWCGYVPAAKAARLAVLVHGSDRDPVAMVYAFSYWADRHGVALLAPLFPGGVPDLDDMHGYKQAMSEDFDFTEILDHAVAEAAASTGVSKPSFELFGFSGGAQFAHRYTILHPRRVRALALVAPGNVTTLSPGSRWWVGVDDLVERCQSPIDWDALREVPVLAMVGSDDDGREHIAVAPSDARWVPGANDAGVTRVERLQTLVQDWRSVGLEVRHIVLSGVAHDFRPFVPTTHHFFDAKSRAAAHTGDPRAS